MVINMENSFKNPMFRGADPFVLFYDGFYYMYCTTEHSETPRGYIVFDTSSDGCDGFFVYRSADLKKWELLGRALKKGDVIGEKWFWAPEVLEYKGKFYMAYSAEEHIAIAVADHPAGPFKQTDKKWLREDRAIDGSLFVDDDGSAYLYYVRLDGGNRIFAAKMKSDLSGIEEEYGECLIKAEEPWETLDCLVAEGPYVLKHKGLYYLTYSANHTRSEDYAMGYAVSDSPIGNFRKYQGNPILKKQNGIVGVGHNSFVRAEDGTLICVYHFHIGKNGYFTPRMFCLNTAQFVESEEGEDILQINGPCSI